MNATASRSIRADRSVIDIFGREVLAMRPSEKRRWTQAAFKHWRESGFPYPNLDQFEIDIELDQLRKIGAEQLQRVLSAPSTVGLRTANSCHPQMWDAKVRGRSPINCFENDEILFRCLEKAVNLWPDRRCWNARCVRILMSIQNRARVSNFRPTVARALIDKLSCDGSEVLDFSAGYGGRLLGAATLNRKYFGIDPATAQCKGLNRLARVVGGNATIVKGCAEDILPTFPVNRFDLIFSSPPYFRLERYSNEPTQSYKRYATYGMWMNNFLKPVLEHSHRVLRRGGRLALNIANIRGFPIAEDATALLHSLFGAPEHIYQLAMSTNPADKARRGNLLRTEPIFVYQK